MCLFWFWSHVLAISLSIWHFHIFGKLAHWQSGTLQHHWHTLAHFGTVLWVQDWTCLFLFWSNVWCVKRSLSFPNVKSHTSIISLDEAESLPNISATFGLRIDNMSSKVHFGLMTNTLICMTSYEAISRQPSFGGRSLSTDPKVPCKAETALLLHTSQIGSFCSIKLSR